MRFRDTSIPGAFVIELEPSADVRGFFARAWAPDEFQAHGLPTTLAQASLSRNHKRGTVRGMHMQLPPSNEAKLVRCTRGAVYDVIVDMRPDSPAFLRHVGVELSAEAGNALFIPALVAHGFQTLTDECDVFYHMTDDYAPHLAYGVRWNDGAFGIDWPIRDGITIVRRDDEYPDFDRQSYAARLAEARG